jgi:cytochrome c oxidase assembly protein subunit 15
LIKNDKLNHFKKWAIASTAITYFLIFVGGLVRVSGAGLGCPDWPKCFGRWIPPFNASQLPADIDPSLFNFTLAWIEYINRLIGMATGLIIAVTAVLAIKNFRKYPKILYSSIAAALLVAFQGWQGGRVVASALEPYVITIHMLIAFIIASLVLFVLLQVMLIQKPELKKSVAGLTKTILVLLYFVTVIQVIIGTQMRSGLEHLAENLPLLTEADWISRLGPVNQIHTVLGILMIFLAVYVTFTGYKNQINKSVYIKNTILGMDILIGVQLLTGIGLVWIGIPPLLQVIHLWISSLIVGVLLMLYTALSQEIS